MHVSILSNHSVCYSHYEVGQKDGPMQFYVPLARVFGSGSQAEQHVPPGRSRLLQGTLLDALSVSIEI